jgi:hypothetical protein
MHPLSSYLALESDKVIFGQSKSLDLFRVLFVEFAIDLCNVADFLQELILGLQEKKKEVSLQLLDPLRTYTL